MFDKNHLIFKIFFSETGIEKFVYPAVWCNAAFCAFSAYFRVSEFLSVDKYNI